MKKVLKIFGITLLIIFLSLLAVPFVFQSQIKDLVKNYVNQNLNAQVAFSDISLSLIRSFPQAHVNVKGLEVTNYKPFEGETLATAKSIAFTMPIKELFKTSSDAPIVVNSISIDEALLTLKTDAFGNTNYTITKTDDTNTSDASNDSNFTFDIEDYSIANSTITYLDESSKIEMFLTELNHSGKGKFSAETSALDTQSEAHISFKIDSTQYLSNNYIKLNALIDLDLEQNLYTFKENTGYINQLPLEFKGFVQLLDEGQEIDLTFKNTGASFKDFLAVIPEAYSKNIEQVKTQGDFRVSGIIKGKNTDTTIPMLDINIVSNNASFKYPNLPKAVENITINTSIKNTTGNTNDTYVDIKTLNFKIDQDVFKSSATLKNLTKNMLVNAQIDGTLNLGHLSKAYPVKLEQELSGILKGNLHTSFDMKALEANAYNRIKNSGNIAVRDVIFSSEDFKSPMQIFKANLSFNAGNVTLSDFNAKTGASDFNANGTINNLIGFILNSDQKLQGNFNLTSNHFVISDFMEETTADDNPNNTVGKTPKIPDFLDCIIHAQANTVVYDNLNLKNLKGTLSIKDQQANLSGLTTTLFDGVLALSGTVSTKTDTPTFSMDLGADGFDISKSFKDLELFQSLAPIAKLLDGKLNSSIHLTGSLNEQLTPKLTAITGNALAEVLTTTISNEQTAVLDKLTSAINFIDFKKLDLKNLKTKLSFENGLVAVQPFKLKYQDIDIEVSGSHGFDKSVNYQAVLQVPAKYLGSEVNRLIGKINDNEVNKISIPVTATISGSYTNPKIATDLTSGISNLTKQLIEIEKQKLINTGKDKIKDFLGGLTGGKQTDTITTPKIDSTKTAVDSTQTTPKDPVKESVKNILGGLIKNRKQQKDKDTTAQK